jgi:uncharacterized protein (DUF427 family)
MSLTMGDAPFGHAPAGQLNPAISPEDFLLWQPFQRRLRASFAGERVVDSRRAMLLHVHGALPNAYFPVADVRMDLLEPNGETAHSELTGTSVYWRARLGDHAVEKAAVSYVDVPDSAPDLADYIGLIWGAFEDWREEDRPVSVHVRDPYHRVDALRTSLPIRISRDGEPLAASEQAWVLYETGLPARWYLPVRDVTVALEPTELITACPYKGEANYWTARTGNHTHENIAWTYRDPEPEIAGIKDHVCFFNERVEIEIDGEPEPKVWTPWAEEGWWLDGPEAEFARAD